ncbi:MAG: CHAT domain-containing protein [Caldilineaceae bacterium]|nr:CHAT domain-containing protein [Caldilineaceae bacterium]
MNVPLCSDEGCKCKHPILVVDNDPEDRADHVKCLKDWGFQLIYEAEGKGNDLLTDAKQKAAEHRCHLALVDMRLRDNDDPDDFSGLELLNELLPTQSILVTGYGNMFITRQALLKKGAKDVVGKQESPERLRSAIFDVMCTSCNCSLNIGYPQEWSAERIARELSHGQVQILPDEVDHVISEIFTEKQKVHIDHLCSATSSPLKSRSRRTSIVFVAMADDKEPVVLKLAHVERVKSEVQNYLEFVEENTGNFRCAQLKAHKNFWRLGGMTYKIIGGDLRNELVYTFSDWYKECDDSALILRPLQEYFLHIWGEKYRAATAKPVDLLEEYFAVWRTELRTIDVGMSLEILLTNWSNQEPTWISESLGHITLLNPYYWLAHNRERLEFQAAKQAIIHGDLHGNNLLVDRENHAWIIDFDRIRQGYLLFDVTELTQYVITCLLGTPNNNLVDLYHVAVTTADMICATDDIAYTFPQSAAASKAIQVITGIKEIAQQLHMYSSPKEYLAGILLEAIFVSLVIDKDEARQEKMLLLASIMCQCLESWRHYRPNKWLPETWPLVARSTNSTNSPLSQSAGVLPEQTRDAHQFTILFLAANPIDTTPLQLEEEARAIKNVLLRAAVSNHVHLKQEWAMRVDEIGESLLKDKPTVVHFSGHGAPNGELIFKNEAGESVAVPTEALSGLFGILKDDIRCVVLNACYSSAQAEAIAQHIDVVIGMSDQLDDTSAQKFAAAFYQGLAYKQSIQRCFDLGCNAIDLHQLPNDCQPQLICLHHDPNILYIT